MADFELASIQVNIGGGSPVERQILNAGGTIAALNKGAQAIAATANAMGKPSYRVKKGYYFANGDIAHEPKGGTDARYYAKRARRGGQKAHAIVVTGNYAAKKDNANNDTLARAMAQAHI